LCLHDNGLYQIAERTRSLNISRGNDSRVGLLIQDGETHSAILLDENEAKHVLNLISGALANSENASPSA